MIHNEQHEIREFYAHISLDDAVERCSFFDKTVHHSKFATGWSATE